MRLFSRRGRMDAGSGEREQPAATGVSDEQPSLLVVTSEDRISSDIALSFSRISERKGEARVHHIKTISARRATLDTMRAAMERVLRNRRERHIQKLDLALLMAARPVPAGGDGLRAVLNVETELVDLKTRQCLWTKRYRIGEGDVLKASDWGKRAAYMIHQDFGAGVVKASHPASHRAA